jgi:cAMP phosphodiesterase
MIVPTVVKGSEITSVPGRKAAIQVICLGSGGGPCEDNVTGFLLRSVATEWARNSLLAVDAGSHLAPITRILERDFPLIYDGKTKAVEQHKQLVNGDDSHQAPEENDVVNGEAPKPEPTILRTGPFAGLKFPDRSARANAMHVLRSYVSAYLITHPHLDHLAGFAINTAAFHATSRPKTVAALPSTVEAMKRHIFNDVIWPNLTDEDGGVGFVTFQRLKEGGDAMVGEGEGRGYIDVCDGLGVRAFKVSHGVCTKSPPAHQHRGSGAGITDGSPSYNLSAQASAHESASSTRRSLSISQQYSAPGTPGATRTSFHAAHQSPHLAAVDSSCVVDSTAFFIRDDQTSREVLFFGDVEPDTLSLSPRNQIVWTEAARKIANGLLGAILIECSYDDSQADAFLFGHMNPRHLITELQNLAALAEEAKMHKQMEEKGAKKRKRSAPANGLLLPEHDRKRSRSMVTRSTTWQDPQHSHRPNDLLVPDVSTRFPTSVSSTTSTIPDVISAQPAVAPLQPDQPDGSLDATRSCGPLSPKSTSTPRRCETGIGVNLGEEMPFKGIQVIIMHVKDTLKDGPHVSENILTQLNDYEARLQEQGQGLGCEFVISKSGESYWV